MGKNKKENDKTSENDSNSDEYIEMSETEIINEFDNMVSGDPELKEMLGEFLPTFSLEDKVAMIHAYKKGGMEGLAEIIDDDYDDEEENSHETKSNCS